MIKRVLLAALLVLCVLDAAAADFTFGRPIRLTTAFNNAGSVAIGDANGDGRQDLASTFFADAGVKLALYLQHADGTLAAPIEMDVPSTYSNALPIAFVDLDKDGREEMFVGLADSDGYVQLVVRLTDGVLVPAAHPGLKGCAYLATGDIDGDGSVDVACHDEQVSATVFFGDGAGGFRNRLDLQTPTGTWYKPWEFKGLQVGDVTGDGRPDLVVTSSLVSAFHVLENNGLGGFWPGAATYPHLYSPTGVYPAAVAIVDTDGDGIDEVVTVNPDNKPDAALNVYKRQVNGYLALAQRVPTWDSTTAIQVHDVDGDGDPELITGHHEFHAVSVIGANGTGLDGQKRFDLTGFGNIPYDANFELVGSSHTIAVGDLDGDSCPDLVGVTFSGLALLYGCEPYFTKIPVSDFDGDGFADALYRYGDNSGVADTVFRAQTRCFRSNVAWTCPLTVEPYHDPRAFGDFDGDGNTDVFWRNPTTGANVMSLAAFYLRQMPTVGPAWTVVGAGDFDHDDRSDLLWRNTKTGANIVWRSADVATQVTLAPVGNFAWKVAAIGDFDGDGHSDLLWRNATSGANTIWRSANNLTQMAIAGVSNPAWKIVGIGDFNADGRDDVVWRNAATAAGTIWLSANSATQRPIAVVGNPKWSITGIADYNGDGYSDLFWRNSETGANTIWLTGNNATQHAVPSWPWWYPMVNPQP